MKILTTVLQVTIDSLFKFAIMAFVVLVVIGNAKADSQIVFSKSYIPNEHEPVGILETFVNQKLNDEGNYESWLERYEVLEVDLNKDGIKDYIALYTMSHGPDQSSQYTTIWLNYGPTSVLAYDDSSYEVAPNVLFKKMVATKSGIFMVQLIDDNYKFTRVAYSVLMEDWMTENYSASIAAEALSGGYPVDFRDGNH